MNLNKTLVFFMIYESFCMPHIRQIMTLIPQADRLSLRSPAFRGARQARVLSGNSIRGYAFLGGGAMRLNTDELLRANRKLVAQ